MITTHSKIEYKLTIFHIKVEVPATPLGFEEVDKNLDEIFEKELRAYDTGIVFKPTSVLEVMQEGFSEFHHLEKIWSRQYIIKITEPVKDMRSL